MLMGLRRAVREIVTAAVLGCAAVLPVHAQPQAPLLAGQDTMGAQLVALEEQLEAARKAQPQD